MFKSVVLSGAMLIAITTRDALLGAASQQDCFSSLHQFVGLRERETKFRPLEFGSNLVVRGFYIHGRD